MEFISSTKGSRKLCYAGYAYTKKNQSKTTVRWECTQRIAHKCNGALITDLAMSMVKSVTDHSHEPDNFAIAALKVKAEIKSSVEANRGQPGQIVADKLSKYSTEVVVAIGRVESLKRSIRRAKHGKSPTEPKTIADIPTPLPDEFTKSLIYDNNVIQRRVLVFANEYALQLLGDAETWFMDGTHSTAPSQFQQLFVIRVPLGESCVSAVYALLPSKHQDVYEECLTALLDTCLHRDIRPNPHRIVADYELSIHNAVRTVLSTSIHIQGCFYHLTQATWRRVQAEGLQATYTADEGIRHFCGMLDSLAFLPVDRVAEGMRSLRDAAPEELAGLVEYFDSTYVSGSFRSVMSQNGTMRFRRTAPRFEPKTWNVHDATLNNEARTNNHCESWNNGFRHLVGHANPSLWTVISCLEKDAALASADIMRYRQGQPEPKRRKKTTVNHQKRLRNLCLQFVAGEKSLSEFLYSMGQCVRIH